MATTALIVEDNFSIRRLVASHLAEASIDVSEAADFTRAHTLATREHFDVAILDVALPDGSGLDLCRLLRSQNNYTPIIMLTARDSDIDRVLGLELGADDYVTKPFSIAELTARVRAQLRRTEAQTRSQVDGPAEPIEAGALSMCEATRVATVNGKAADLTAREFDLLNFLARHPGRVFSRLQLLDSVWGTGFSGYEHTVNSHINRLRTKIESDPSKPEFIKTVWGVGYAFRTDGETS